MKLYFSLIKDLNLIGELLFFTSVILKKLIDTSVDRCVIEFTVDLEKVDKNYRPIYPEKRNVSAFLGPIVAKNMSKIDLEFCHKRLLNEYEYSQELRRRQEAVVIAEKINWD